MRARIRKKKDAKENERLNEVFKKYHETVNMSYSELKAWSETEYSKLASEDRGPIQRNLRLLSKKKEEWTSKDIEDANKTIAFVGRMKNAEQGEPAKKGAPSKRDISLKNWAYDPGKKKDSSEMKQTNKSDSNGKSFRRDFLGSIQTKEDKCKTDTDWLASKTDEGYLRLRGRIARTGAQLYCDTQGNEWYEYRSPEEVEKSAKTFNLQILTDDHPPVMLTVENCKEYDCGHLGAIEFDGKYLTADILITDPELIRKIEAGEKNELSCGYHTTVDEIEITDPDTGRLCAGSQKDIVGNHCSVVEEGRAGPECGLYLDAKSAVQKKGTIDMKRPNKDAKMVLEGKEYEISEEQLKMLMELLAPKPEGEEAPMDEDPMDEEPEESMDQEEEKKPEESMDAMKAKIDSLKAQLKEANDTRKIDARIALVDTAKSLGLDHKGKTDAALKAAIVKAVTPSMDLAGKSRDYVDAAYESALLAHKRNTDSNRELFVNLDNLDSVDGKGDSKLDTLRAKMYGRKGNK